MSGTSTPISDEADSNTSMEEDRELLLQSTAMNTIEPEDNGIAAMEPARKTGAGERVRREEVTSYVWFMVAMISISGLLFGLDTGIISQVCYLTCSRPGC